MGKKVLDPVEDAKLPAAGKKKDHHQRSEDAMPQPVEPWPLQAEVPSSPARPVEPPPLPPAPVGVLVEAKRYRVLESKVISWYGSITHMAAGSIVDVAGYGPQGITRLLDQGVRLEPMAD